ncbi:MAG: 1,4-alpha-glucan branching enzyme [Phototrophicales bacterium]|nr:MAG: 1,4-alpha-glucan branching enzyme [Phototrophicales bacterium]
MTTTHLHPDAIAALVHGDHGAPFDILGPHPVDDQTVIIRAFRPTARELAVITEQHTRYPMTRIHEYGLFEVEVPITKPIIYQLEETTFEGNSFIFDDPYRFPPSLGDLDLYLHSEGRHLEIYKKLGAHLIEQNGVKGVRFAVWAPNAKRVSVIGNFNNWDGRVHPMQTRGGAIWELFIPNLQVGEIYKYEILSCFHDYRAEKADPYAFGSELRPLTASIVTDLSTYEWNDSEWMNTRTHRDILTEPMSIYEVHLGSWKRKEGNQWLTYRELADELIPYVKDMGYTHIELMPIAEHPFDGSWGYQVTGYYAPTRRYGVPQDFMYFVDQCHQNDIGVILDWVPAHFPKDGYALSYFDGTHLYEHADPRQGEHPDWGTYIFNYGRNEVRNFLLANALFWLKEYHIDGLRVDAVSSMIYLDFSRKEGEWVPNEYGGNENLAAISFLKEFNEIVHREVQGAFTIAEESTAWPMVSRPTYLGGLGFTFKWNMGWMHDTLLYFQKDPIYRRYHHNNITFSLAYAFSENFILSLSHDEVVHGKGSLIGKMAGDWWQKFASLRALYGYQYTHPGKKLLFMGQEFGQWSEWSEARSLDWHLTENFQTHQQLQRWVKDLNTFYQTQPALYEQDFTHEGFRWIEANDADQSVFTYMRFAKDPNDFLVIACNFTPVPRHHYRVGVPKRGRYIELLNSDSEIYGGGNLGNLGSVYSTDHHWHGYEQSIVITVPPLAVVILRCEPYV